METMDAWYCATCGRIGSKEELCKKCLTCGSEDTFPYRMFRCRDCGHLGEEIYWFPDCESGDENPLEVGETPIECPECGTTNGVVQVATSLP